MFLVGGYSQSLWLQEKITERFSDRLKIILPDMAFVSVLRGAVMYDLNRSDTPSYKAKHSYAVGIIKPFVDNTHPIGKKILYYYRFSGVLIFVEGILRTHDYTQFSQY